MHYKTHRGLISDMSGSSHCQPYGVVWLSSHYTGKTRLFLSAVSGHSAQVIILHCSCILMGTGPLWNCPETQWQHSSCGRRSTGPPHPVVPCCLLFLPSPSLPFFFFFLKLWAEYFQTLEYFQICRLIEIHVIYVWKWSRWTWHLILCWSNALNFNLCSATCFFTLSKTQQLCVPQPTHLFKHIWWCDPLQLTHILWDCCKSALACD